MKKTYVFILIFIIIITIALGVYFYKTYSEKQTSNNSSSYSAVKASDTTNTTNNTSTKNISQINTSNENLTDNNISSDDSNTTVNNTENNNIQNTATEELLSDFTTKIYTKDSERQNNISITCNTLNDTYVEIGSTFSFCDTVGKATSSKGYQKADVFKDGEVIKALGGGNCQVSTTLYNAVLEVPELKVTERHEHSNSVPYISKGKDAAVAYGSYDFKFINNSQNNIKISASCDTDFVYIKLFKIL